MRKPIGSTKRRPAAALAAGPLVILLAGLSAGCAGFYVQMPGPEAGGPPVRQGLPFPPLSNNSTARLEAGDYRGDVAVAANKVTIVGRGRGVTRILGSVTISGNSCVMSELTITGSVRITGNNADLRGAQIQGAVRSTGNNNRW